MKKSNRKLTLNRDTVRNLSPNALEAVGGAALTKGVCLVTVLTCQITVCNQTCGINCVAPGTSNAC
jgi:hypothetical protein